MTTEPFEYPEDYDDGPEPYAKDEPDCMSCNDSGCPDCGRVDPANPAHMRYLARQVLLTRARGEHLDGDGRAKEVTDELMPVDGATRVHADALRRLVDSATVTIGWAEPGSGHATGQPF
jgi:hypothetical protein